MTTSDFEERDPCHIPRPEEASAFQRMCVDIYGAEYYDPRAAQYGRHGQAQHGTDLYFTDWRGQLDGHMRLVWVQCKNTSGETLAPTNVKGDIIKAAKKVRKSSTPRVTVFIVATSAPNDANLLVMLEELKAEMNAAGTPLPFTVSFDTWDTLCGYISKNRWLWERFNNHPDHRIADRHREPVRHLIYRIKAACNKGDWKEAQEIWKTWKDPAVADTYGPLRETLLRLAYASGDVEAEARYRAQTLNLIGWRDVAALVDDLLVQRTVYALKPPAGDSYSNLLASRWHHLSEGDCIDNIPNLQGSPDDIACLALVLIMETDDRALHDAAIELVRRMAYNLRSVPFQDNVAEVALAIVRRYYLLRHGWTEASAFTMRSDRLFTRGEYQCVFPRTAQRFDLTTHFAREEGENLINPSVMGAYCDRVLWSQRGQDGHCPYLSKLQRQCEIYRLLDSNCRQLYAPTAYQITDRWVSDAATLMELVTAGAFWEGVQVRQIFIPRQSYELLLGHLAVARAAATKGLEQVYGTTAAVAERVLAFCVWRPGAFNAQPWQITVMPSYDTPPVRLVAYSGTGDRVGVTLHRELIARVQDRIEGRAGYDAEANHLERLYARGDDELAAACQLALHLTIPLLTSDAMRSELAAEMGVGSAHPAAIYRRAQR